MAVNQTMGRASISYGSPVFIKASGSVVGQMESEGPLGSYFDKVGTDKDDLFGADSWEKAESALLSKLKLTVYRRKCTYVLPA